MGAADAVVAVNDDLPLAPVGEFVEPLRQFTQGNEPCGRQGAEGVFTGFPDVQQGGRVNFEDENEYNRACLEAICGNTDRALELLQIALQTRQTYIKWAKTDPDLDSLHGDQRFKTLLSAFATSV